MESGIVCHFCTRPEECVTYLADNDGSSFLQYVVPFLVDRKWFKEVSEFHFQDVRRAGCPGRE